MTDFQEAIARARQIAMQLGGSDLGKRKFDDMSAPGLGAIKREKVYIPVYQFPDINFLGKVLEYYTLLYSTWHKGLLIGPKGATQKQLQDRTGAKILIRGRGSQKEGQPVHPDDNDDLHVSIEGTEAAVEAARKEVEEILYNPEEAMRLKGEQLRSLGGNSGSSYGPSEHQEELKVPNPMVGLIIGRGGENIQKLQSQTGAHIQIARESEMKPGDTHRSIFIRGSRSNVADMRQKIEDIVNSRTGGSGRSGSGSKELTNPIVLKVPVPNERVGYIIGKSGMNVRNIQEKTQTTILIPQDADEDDPNTRTISIGADTKEAAEAAHAEIFMTLQQYAMNNTINPANTMLFLIPDDKVGMVIGKAGVNIKDLQSRHRVKVQIPPTADLGSNPPVRTCTIQGPPENQAAARYEIEMILQGQGGGSQSYGYGAGSSAWGGYAYDPSLYGQYASYYGLAATAQSPTTATATTDAATAAPTDPTAYYDQYWQYASYYGEAAARIYYGAWSPPEGTPPPAGIVLPSSSTNTASASTPEQSTSISSESKSTTDPTIAANPPSETTAAVATDANATSQDTDPWEAYKKQYAEWYEAHGKHIGADPNPTLPTS